MLSCRAVGAKTELLTPKNNTKRKKKGKQGGKGKEYSRATSRLHRWVKSDWVLAPGFSLLGLRPPGTYVICVKATAVSSFPGIPRGGLSTETFKKRMKLGGETDF